MHMDTNDTQEYPLHDIEPTEADDTLWKREGGHYRMQVQAAKEIILTFDADGVIGFVNQGGLDMTGYIEDELVGMKIGDVFPPDDLARLERELSFRAGSGQVEITIPESHFINRELELMPVEINLLARFREGVRREVILIARNISGRLRLESERRRKAKSALTRRFAGGVIADLQNLVEDTLNDIEFALSTLDSGNNTLFRRLTDAREGCNASLRRLRRLKCLTDTPEIAMGRASLRNLLHRSTESVMDETAAKCEFWLPDALWPVKGDEALLTRAFEQLIRNAAEAMGGNGMIQIRADNDDTGPDLPREFSMEGAFVSVTIRDHGKGIRQADLETILDPYVGIDGGLEAGLGLAFADAVIQAHGGRLDLFSEAGLGTVARIYLPALREPSTVTTPEKMADRVADQTDAVKKNRVLVMDDEPIVREVATEMLEGLGYRVVAVDRAEAAIERFAEASAAGEPFRVVVLDLNPGRGAMGGRAVMASLVKIDPRVRGIAASGYSGDPEMTDFAGHGFSAALPKPFTRRDLAAAVADVLRNQ